MFLGQVVDLMRGKIKDMRHGSMVLPPDMVSASAPTRQLVLAKLKQAQAFDFGCLILERSDEAEYFKSPTVTDDELQFWTEGLIPFPYPCCWYEFSMSENGAEDPDHAKISVLFWERGDGGYFATGFAAAGPKQKHIKWSGIVLEVDRSVMPEKKMTGSDFVLTLLNKLVEEGQGDKVLSTARAINALPSQVLYLTLMLNSKTTDVDASPPVNWFHRKRNERKGLWQVESYRIVNIVPDRFRRFAESEIKGTHASPRLHWRRSHLRHYASGKVAVVARCLVGAAEAGSVSHEYRVINRKQTNEGEKK